MSEDRPTRDQVLVEPAGPQLDIWVAELVMGLRLYRDPNGRVIVDQNDRPDSDRDVPAYSTSWEGAGQVVDLLAGRGNNVVWVAHTARGRKECRASIDALGGMTGAATACATAQEAICKAALLHALAS